MGKRALGCLAGAIILLALFSLKILDSTIMGLAITNGIGGVFSAIAKSGPIGWGILGGLVILILLGIAVNKK